MFKKNGNRKRFLKFGGKRIKKKQKRNKLKTMKLFIGLMGVKNDERTLVAPNGKILFKAPKWLAWRIQKAQHKIASLTHSFYRINI